MIRVWDETELGRLADAIGADVDQRTSITDWPAEGLRQCAGAGIYRWFLPALPSAAGGLGLGWSPVDQTRAYLRLSMADLTTTFVITQSMVAIKRIAGSGNQLLIDRWLKDLCVGRAHATVGFSHLTTSRQHLGRRVLRAEATPTGFRLSGMSPWVTGAPHADLYVIGAGLDDGREILIAVPRETRGVCPGAGAALRALPASCTDKVQFDDVELDRSMLIAGPVENVMAPAPIFNAPGTSSSGAGSYQTSTLAIGLAKAASAFLNDQAARREGLQQVAQRLSDEVNSLEATLLQAVDTTVDPKQKCEAATLRGQANDLVLRTTTAALTAAKGAGLIHGHPAGRWCSEALFFLVWSCPEPISQALLCELAGIS